ncbi:MAG: hypothetical protein LV473_21020 [Nitrospira sp.]|nr:hypothetical protein [Nitrospira sp.]
MNGTTNKMIDGRQALLTFARAYHHRHEHSIVDLEKLLKRLGFEVTDANEDRVIILGPMQTTTSCRTLVLFGGRMKVRHIELVRALERLMEVGLPVWKTEAQQFEWHCAQLERCAPFQIRQPEEFESWEDMANHVEGCTRCQPAFRALQAAVDRGSSRTGEKHMRELIEKSHADSQASLKFYEGIRDAQLGLGAMVAEKPRGGKREVPA